MTDIAKVYAKISEWHEHKYKHMNTEKGMTGFRKSRGQGEASENGNLLAYDHLRTQHRAV